MDPFKSMPPESFGQGRIVAASLEDTDGGQENTELKELAVKQVIQKEEAFKAHARRTYREYKNCDYSILDVSSLELKHGAKAYYKKMRQFYPIHTHRTIKKRTLF